MLLVMVMDAQPNIRLLKTVVIVLGVLIVVGLAVVIGTIAQRLSRMADGGDTVSLPPAAAFGERRVELPSGSVVLNVLPAGERLILRVRLRTGAEQLVVLHLGTGDRLGSFEWASE